MKVLTLVIFMMLVTYIPRLLPMYFIDAEKIPGALKKFLSFIPYAALGALILPGSINAINGRPEVSAAAIVISAIIAWFNSNIIVTVLLTVAATYLLLFSGL